MFKYTKTVDEYANWQYKLVLGRLEFTLYYSTTKTISWSFHIHWLQYIYCMGTYYPNYKQLFYKRGLYRDKI